MKYFLIKPWLSFWSEEPNLRTEKEPPDICPSMSAQALSTSLGRKSTCSVHDVKLPILSHMSLLPQFLHFKASSSFSP